MADKLARLGVRSVEDLLFLLPIRYEDRTRLVEIGALRPGMRITIEGEVELTEIVFRRRRMMLCRIADGTGALLLRFFHFYTFSCKLTFIFSPFSLLILLLATKILFNFLSITLQFFF